MREFRIGDRRVGGDEPCFVIAEAGANHNRDLSMAKALIDVAVEAGADAVKFQTYSAETLYSKKTPRFSYLGSHQGDRAAARVAGRAGRVRREAGHLLPFDSFRPPCGGRACGARHAGIQDRVLRDRRSSPHQPRGLERTTHDPLDRPREEHTSELQSQSNLVCRLLLEKKKT